ncbi:MAG TPA: type II secretion system protein [Acidobacteriaceae bacterium]
MEERPGQEGYVLIGVLFLVFMMLVALSIAAPRMAASIERDREVEMQHRAKQYVRAIKLYYKKFGGYPPTLEALEKQNEIRFLRKRYRDPITGKADWKVIHFGQNKMPTAYGFFGQPMAGSSIAGIGPGAAGVAGGGLFGNNGSNIGSIGLGASSLGSPTTTTTTGTTTGTTDSSGNTTGGTGNSSDSGTGSTGSTSAFGSASNGQTFGGAGIIGVESTSAKKSILEYHKKVHFNEWEFVYDPMADQVTLSNNTNIGTPVGTPSSGGVATPGTFSNQPTNTTIPPQQQQTPSAPQQPTTPQQ